MPLPNHVALKQKIAIQTQMKNAAIAGDNKLFSKLHAELQAINKKLAGK